jgi:hypothetical protein
VEEVEGSKVEYLAGFGRLWCGGEHAWPWQSSRWRLLAGEDSETGEVREWENLTGIQYFTSTNMRE